MKLNEILFERRRAPRGTYYGVHPTPETIAAVQEFMKGHGVPNPIDMHGMHCTMIQSREWCGEPPLGKIEPHWQGQFHKYHLWQTNPYDEQEEADKCLTLGFHCPQMQERHKHLRSRGATHIFPDFTPHLTLSYDVGHGYDHSKLPPYNGPLMFHHEYSEPLNLDWVNTKLAKK